VASDAQPPLEEVACDLCGGMRVTVLRAAESSRPSARNLAQTFRASADAPLTERLVQCADCGLVFVSPRVAAGAIASAYADGDDPGFVSQAGVRERTFARQVARMEALTGGPGRVFDVGTAGGSFLAAARTRGWQVDGCEPNAWLAEWGARRYGLDIRHGTLATLDLPREYYDAVTLWDVIEHLTEPSAELARARVLLKPGGHLFMTFPDIESLPARLLGRRWPCFSAVHIYYFSKATMGRMLERSGFELIEARPHMPRLELGYGLERAGDVAGAPMRALSRLAETAGWGRLQVPFWIGQTLVAARRR